MLLRKVTEKQSKMKKRIIATISWKKLEELKNTNSQEYWQLLNKLRNQEKQDFSTSIQSETWISHFNKLFTPNYDDPKLNETLIELGNKTGQYTELDYPISEKELYESINSLKNKKTSGPDGILNEMLKCGKYYLVKPIAYLFNMILSQSSIPQDWKQGYLRVIYKSGDINLPENYRGIAICSCLGKLFTKTIIDYKQN